MGRRSWKVIIMVSLPRRAHGIITGVLLAIARISGETAPLLFTALNNQFWSTDMNAPMANLPVTIFQFALSPYEDWQHLAWAGALLITVAILVLNIVARALPRCTLVERVGSCTAAATRAPGRGGHEHARQPRRREDRHRREPACPGRDGAGEDRASATSTSSTARPRR